MKIYDRDNRNPITRPTITVCFLLSLGINKSINLFNNFIEKYYIII